MQQKVSYGIRIKDDDGQIKPHLERTIDNYGECLADITIIVLKHWEGEISLLDTSKEKHNAVERLIHTTKDNKATYPEWDAKYPNYPSYLRRATIMDAIGHVSSYKSNYANWVAQGKKGREPRLGATVHPSPSLYNTNMFKWDGKSTRAEMKLLKQDGEWGWFGIELVKTDVDYILRHHADHKRSAPTLTRRGKGYDLVMMWQYDVPLSNTPIEEQLATIIDLGVNAAAAAMVMDARGEISSRKMFKYPEQERKLEHSLNIVKKRQQHGSTDLGMAWRDADDMNRHISEQTTADIVEYASANNSDVIVFEYLDMKGKIRGKSRRQRLSIWRHRSVQKGVELRSHDAGMRISRVNPYGSSIMAHDGSGKCKRGRDIEDGDCVHGYGVVELPSGSLYSSEYNATMNLGARYFLRGLLASLPKRRRKAIVKRLPQLEHPASCVYADLLAYWRVCDELEEAAAKKRKKRKRPAISDDFHLALPFFQVIL